MEIPAGLTEEQEEKYIQDFLTWFHNHPEVKKMECASEEASQAKASYKRKMEELKNEREKSSKH